MTTFLVTGALSSCNHTDELEPESPAPQIVFLFSPGGLGDMSYNDRILEGVQRFIAYLYECRNNVVRLPEGRTAVIKGLQDYVVAEQGEILMICPRSDVAAMRRMHNDTKFS